MFAVLAMTLLPQFSENAEPCRQISGFEELVRDPHLNWFIVGETHGTAEMPASFGDLACELGATRRDVVVGIEFPVSEQHALDAYMKSSGSERDREALLKSSFWTGRDGRSSEAYLDLLERLRELARRHRIARVIGFQPQFQDGPAQYEQAMAENVRRLADAPDASVLVLVGNLHAQRLERSTAQRAYLPMAGWLPRDRTVTLNMVGDGGAAWACVANAQTGGSNMSPNCGPHRLPRSANTYPAGLVLTNDANAPYSGWINLGEPTSASAPASSPGVDRH